MGTMLYSKGVFINQCYDELNVRAPDLVRDIHRAVRQRRRGRHRDEQLRRESTEARAVRAAGSGEGAESRRRDGRARSGRRRALVAGAVGPLGVRLEPYGPTSKDEARAIFREQMEGLAEGGVDLFILETFSDLDEIEQAILAARAVDPKKPIIAQMTIGADCRTPYGASPEDVVARARRAGAPTSSDSIAPSARRRFSSASRRWRRTRGAS